MEPIIALIGHFNVGKSTLFNRLTKTADSLVSNIPGVTRDRKYGYAKLSGLTFIVIDTAGFEDVTIGVEQGMISQSLIAIEEADIVLFVVDSTVGIIVADQKIAKYLHKYKKMVFVVVNKINRLDGDLNITNFRALGFENINAIDAVSGYGIIDLFKKITLYWQDYIKNNVSKINTLLDTQILTFKENNHLKKHKLPTSLDLPIRLAIVGRPNVGKSTLINCILGKNRVIVHDTPGTTRDSVYISIKYLDQNYIIIDTAGVRKRNNVNHIIEKYSINKTLQAIDDSNVVLLIINAHEEISHQDYYLLNFINSKGKSLVIVINKCDNLSWKVREEIEHKIKLRLGFINFARIHFISALYSIGINDLFKSVNEAYICSRKHVNSSLITKIMNLATKNHKPPLINGNPIKMKYAHIGSHNPLTIIIHGNRLKFLPKTYKRYLVAFFSKSMNIIGSLIRIQLKETKNPYK
ncbi:ribosome biogenesis GTPase Der [Candidatus Pantoea edessiphila]|uniref:GTPase Der n=1 Tax=Candidatus Pantoea edessiphila TaxID=2044610 RepID=A0A2P5SWJ1_9GAMM|nr:ribosome biogenesis GTPase Der [Candidatus Pantoea edessiphila]PPI86683.1 ribosome biogenesis GTPase Der [Candidatus Pantoea edessiphila]